MIKINKAGVLIEVGSKWEQARLNGSNIRSPYKVMGFVDSWVMIRRKMCSPTCVHMNSFGTEYVTK